MSKHSKHGVDQSPSQHRDPLPDDPAYSPCICHGETLESAPEWVLRQLPSPTWPVERPDHVPWRLGGTLDADPVRRACVEGLP